jgi:peptidoglycan/LPS O-acetylase OafA/YrhL
MPQVGMHSGFSQNRGLKPASAAIPKNKLTMSVPAPYSPRNDGIDLLRGLAILLVVIHHCALPFRLPLAQSWLGLLLDRRWTDALSFNGYESVFIFFVISGFVITRRIIERDGALETMDWRAFYSLRVARIAPLLLSLLGVLALLHLAAVPGFVIDGAGQTLPGALTSALTMTLNWYEGHTDWLPGAWDVLWSLSIEEVFYLGFPLLCLALCGKAGRVMRGLFLALLALSLPWTYAALSGNEIWQEKAYLPGMAGIATGVLAAMAVQGTSLPSRTRRVLGIGGGIGIFAVLCYGDYLWQSLLHHTLLLLCLSVACCLVACHGSRRSAPKALRWLTQPGRWSYEIYLSHMFLVLPVTGLYRMTLGNDLRWTCCVYPPLIFACGLLGKMLHCHFTQPAAQRIMQVLVRWRAVHAQVPNESV